MAVLVVDRKGAELTTDGRRLVIRVGDHQQAVPFTQLTRLVVASAATVHSPVLLRLAEHGVGCVVVGRRRECYIVNLSHGDTQRRVMQAVLSQDTDRCRVLSCQLVRGKISQQRRFLNRLMRERPDQRRTLYGAKKTLDSSAKSLLAMAGDHDWILGIEGSAAKAYFRALQVVVPPPLEFVGRNRRPAKDPFNALLSLSYAMVHAEARYALAIAGLDPAIGFLHGLAYGRDSLACDLTELLRPMSDRFSWELVAARTLDHHHFEIDEHGACRLTKSGRQIYYPAWYHLQRECARRARRIARHWVNVIGELSDG